MSSYGAVNLWVRPLPEEGSIVHAPETFLEGRNLEETLVILRKLCTVYYRAKGERHSLYTVAVLPVDKVMNEPLRSFLIGWNDFVTADPNGGFAGGLFFSLIDDNDQKLKLWYISYDMNVFSVDLNDMDVFVVLNLFYNEGFDFSVSTRQFVEAALANLVPI